MQAILISGGRNTFLKFKAASHSLNLIFSNDYPVYSINIISSIIFKDSIIINMFTQTKLAELLEGLPEWADDWRMHALFCSYDRNE
jgi:hypothetical protein